MNKQDQLTSLFNTWKTRDHYVKANQFLRDGLINETEYNKQATKLLFIGKEANGLKEPDLNLTENWSNEGLSGLYDRTISQWAYGIQHNFPPFDDIYGDENRARRYEALQKISIME